MQPPKPPASNRYCAASAYQSSCLGQLAALLHIQGQGSLTLSSKNSAAQDIESGRPSGEVDIATQSTVLHPARKRRPAAQEARTDHLIGTRRAARAGLNLCRFCIDRCQARLRAAGCHKANHGIPYRALGVLTPAEGNGNQSIGRSDRGCSRWLWADHRVVAMMQVCGRSPNLLWIPWLGPCLSRDPSLLTCCRRELDRLQMPHGHVQNPPKQGGYAAQSGFVTRTHHRDWIEMMRHCRGEMRLSAAAVLSLALLQGCMPAPLPKCYQEQKPQVIQAKSIPTKKLIVGIDGSGSMLGHSQAKDSSQWLSLLQSINLSAKNLGLAVGSYRIGGGASQSLGAQSVSAAANPCFFKGCDSYAPVASSLQTLWGVRTQGPETPLRLLVSDLEVNDSDISSLIAAIKKDLAKGASAGVLAVKLPFNGQVYNAKGTTIFEGELDRPVYLLATGNVDQVRTLLEDIRKNMALKGVATQELSVIDASSRSQTLTVKGISAIPQATGTAGVPLFFEGRRYTPSNNSQYRFIKLKDDASGVSLTTARPWREGAVREDLGLVKLERIPLAGDGTTSLGGVRIAKMSVSGSDLRIELEIPPSTPPGAIRATVPRGSLPEQWWMEWDRDDPKGRIASTKTEGLLLLMTTLSQQVQMNQNATPAAALCVAFQHS